MTWRLEITLPCPAGALASLGLLLSACGEDSKPNPASTEDGGEPDEALATYEPCAIEQKVGDFTIDLADDYTSVSGGVADRVVPDQVPLELASEGTCRLIAPPDLNCDPPCAFSTQTCGIGDVCVPNPQGRDVGTVTVRGLSAAVSMAPNGNTKGYSAAPPVPHPGFEPGANISLSTAGGDYEPIALRGWGVSLFELTEPVRVDAGMATVLRWATPADPGPAHVVVRLEINLHGSTPGAIECDFPDTGSAEIPGTLIDALIARGVTGFPTITITRQSASSAQIPPGCVEFVVMSKVVLPVAVAGLTSCNPPDTPCPDGRTCRAVEMFCE